MNVLSPCYFARVIILRYPIHFVNIKIFTNLLGSEEESKSIIDFIIMNEKIWPYTLDTRVYRWVEIGTDHYIVCSKSRIPKKISKKKIQAMKRKEDIKHSCLPRSIRQ